jgi:hypothetical protein
MFDRVKTVTLTPYQSAFCKTKTGDLDLASFHDAIYVSDKPQSSGPVLIHR